MGKWTDDYFLATFIGASSVDFGNSAVFGSSADFDSSAGFGSSAVYVYHVAVKLV